MPVAEKSTAELLSALDAALQGTARAAYDGSPGYARRGDEVIRFLRCVALAASTLVARLVGASRRPRGLCSEA